jgi:hypothetical protein
MADGRREPVQQGAVDAEKERGRNTSGAQIHLAGRSLLIYGSVALASTGGGGGSFLGEATVGGGNPNRPSHPLYIRAGRNGSPWAAVVGLSRVAAVGC